jgi:hypothetical protein
LLLWLLLSSLHSLKVLLTSGASIVFQLALTLSQGLSSPPAACPMSVDAGRKG